MSTNLINFLLTYFILTNLFHILQIHSVFYKSIPYFTNLFHILQIHSVFQIFSPGPFLKIFNKSSTFIYLCTCAQ